MGKQVSTVEKDLENFKDNFSTKADLIEVKSELKTEIANVKAEMLKWYIGTIITIIVVMTGVIGGAFTILLKLLGH